MNWQRRVLHKRPLGLPLHDSKDPHPRAPVGSTEPRCVGVPLQIVSSVYKARNGLGGLVGKVGCGLGG